MIRTDRFALDVDTFAAQRRKILERSDERFLRPVIDSLFRFGLPGWEDNIVQMALDIFDETAREEVDEWNPIIDDMRDEFERELRQTLAKTKLVDESVNEKQSDAQVERLTRWLSTYSVNAGTEAATTSDPDGAVGLEWVTMGDKNVRALHVETNGETVPSGLPFSVGEYELLYPGQPVGPPEVWINCRCVARPTMLEEFKVKTTKFKSEAVSLEESAESSSLLEVADGRPTAVVAAASDEVAKPDMADVPAGQEDAVDPTAPTPWYGVLAPEGVPSGDGRQFNTNGLTHRDLPLPIKAMFVDDEGHKGSVIVGRIDNIFRENGLVKGEGVFDTSAAAQETIRMLANGMWRGVSVDIDDMEAQLSEDGAVSSANGRICAATICAIPAFKEAFVALGTWADAEPQPTFSLDTGTIIPEVSRRGAHTGETMTLTAAVEAPALSGGYFKDPELIGPTPFTVTEDGRVYGHVATWDACHIGLPIGDEEGDCTTAPHSATNYAFFLTGEVLTDLGPVAVGQITMGGGHATGRATLRAAISHYDSTSTAVADVTAGEDEHGIWVAGMLRPNVTAEQVHELRAAAISGDWRQVKVGREDMELIAALAVNVPGFPIPRPSMLVASGGQTLSLTAAAIPLAEGQDAGDSIEIPTNPVEKFNATRAKFRQLQVDRAKSVFAVSE